MKLLVCLTAMVEGHFQSLQTWLSYQPNSHIQVNLLMESVRLLGHLMDLMLGSDEEKAVDGDHVLPDLMIYTLKFLIEMVQGPCRLNQEALTSARGGVIPICNRYLSFQFHRLECIANEEKERHLKTQSLQSEVKKAMLTLKVRSVQFLTTAHAEVLSWTLSSPPAVCNSVFC